MDLVTVGIYAFIGLWTMALSSLGLTGIGRWIYQIVQNTSDAQAEARLTTEKLIDAIEKQNSEKKNQ